MSQFKPILYSFRRCPYAMRARMSLVYAKITCELREVDLKNKTEQLLSISPKGTVPVLQCPNDVIIEESLDIMEWSLKQHDPDNWSSRRDEGYIKSIQTEFVPALMRYKYADRYKDEVIDVAEQRQRCFDLLIQLNERLHQGFFHGDVMGFTDVAVFPFVRQYVAVDPQWFNEKELVYVKAWLKCFSHDALFEKAMQRVPPWIFGQLAVEFPSG
jgi:glutathione S-transferase